MRGFFSGAPVSANWLALKATLAAAPKPAHPHKRRKLGADAHDAPHKRPERIADTEGLTPVVAVDCEMVGVGPEGRRSSLARC